MDSKTRDLDVVKTEIEEEFTPALRKPLLVSLRLALNVDFPGQRFYAFWQLPLDTFQMPVT